jgi:hypothetical protein
MTQLGQEDIDLGTNSSANYPRTVASNQILKTTTNPKSVTLLRKLGLVKTDQGALHMLLIITLTCFALAVYLYYNIFNPPQKATAEDVYQRVQDINARRNI